MNDIAMLSENKLGEKYEVRDLYIDDHIEGEK